MRNPLPLVALLYASGLLVASYLPACLIWLLALSLGLALLALWSHHLRRTALWLLLPLVAWTNFEAQTSELSPCDLRSLQSDRTEFVTIRGTLCDAPVLRLYEQGARVSERSVVEIDLQSLQRKTHWESAFGRVTASVAGGLSGRFFAGQLIEVRGVLQPPKGPAAPGQFDYRAYLSYRGVFYQLKTESTNDWQIVSVGNNSPDQPPLAARFYQWAQRTLARGLPAEDESLRLLWAMVLGWKTALTQEVAEPFMQSGTLHIFAISGLHIALISDILIRLLRVGRVPRPLSGLVVIPLIWFYTAATGWQASAIRSTVMMSIVIAGWALERPSNLLNSLAAAALVILIWDPTQLFQASFQLSFFVVLGLALIVPPLERKRVRLLQPDPLLPPELRPRWKQWLARPLRWVTQSLVTSLAAWLGSMPLIAFYFYMITPGSLLANMVIVPLSSLALMSSLGSLVCGDWLPSLTVLFNHSSWLWMFCMIHASQWFASLPGAYFYVPQPSLAVFVVYYLLLAGILSGIVFTRRWRAWVGLALTGLAAVWLVHWCHIRDITQLTILPTAAGSTFVDLPGIQTGLLIDPSDLRSAQAMVKPFLRSQGVNGLPVLLLSHGDQRHIGGTEFIAQHFRARQITTSQARFRSPVYRALVGQLEASPGRWRQIGRGDKLGPWTVLHPSSEDRFAQGDNQAMVLRGTLGGVRVLYKSSLAKLGERALLNREAALQADILIAGMPTQGEPVSEQLLDAVQPRLVIVAGAEFPATFRPSRALRERLRLRNIPVIYTSDSGAAILRCKAARWTAKTMDGRQLSGLSNRPGPPP